MARKKKKKKTQTLMEHLVCVTHLSSVAHNPHHDFWGKNCPYFTGVPETWMKKSALKEIKYLPKNLGSGQQICYNLGLVLKCYSRARARKIAT